MTEESRAPEQAQERNVEVRKGAAPGEIEKAPRWSHPLDEMERLVDEYFPRGWLRRLEWPAVPEFARRMEMRLPRVDVIDRDDEVMVRAETPGVDKKDLDISVTGNTVTIKGQSSREEREERGDYYRSEISRGSFSRTVSLPAEVDGGQARASFKDGMLELVLPKKPESRRHPISID